MHCGTGISPNRDIVAVRRHVAGLSLSLRPRHLPLPAHPRGKPGFSSALRYFPRETDCLLEGDGFELPVPRHESPGFSAHGGRSLPDSPLEETGFEPEVPAREGWVPLVEWEPSQRRQQAAETVPYLSGPSVRIPVVEAGGAPASACVWARLAVSDAHDALSSIFLAFAVSALGRTRCKTPSFSLASIRSRSMFSESVKTRS